MGFALSAVLRRVFERVFQRLLQHTETLKTADTKKVLRVARFTNAQMSGIMNFALGVRVAQNHRQYQRRLWYDRTVARYSFRLVSAH